MRASNQPEKTSPILKKSTPIDNPGAWLGKVRQEISDHIAPTREEKTLHAVEHAIQLLQMVQLGHVIDTNELRLVQKQLRDVRLEYLFV